MRTFAYIAILGMLALTPLSGCSDREVKSDTDQNGVDQKDRAQSDIDLLQGTWQMVMAEQKGMPSTTFANMDVVIEGNILMFMKESEMRYKGIITLDPSKEPKTLDMEVMSIIDGQEKGEVSQGIYMVEYDTFKWCNAAPGADDRPSEFSTNQKENHLLLILKREQK